METANDPVVRYADMFAAMGTESRLRIMQLLLSAHPDGMVVGEIQEELGVSASNPTTAAEDRRRSNAV